MERHLGAEEVPVATGPNRTRAPGSQRVADHDPGAHAEIEPGIQVSQGAGPPHFLRPKMGDPGGAVKRHLDPDQIERWIERRFVRIHASRIPRSGPLPSSIRTGIVPELS